VGVVINCCPQLPAAARLACLGTSPSHHLNPHLISPHPCPHPHIPRAYPYPPSRRERQRLHGAGRRGPAGAWFGRVGVGSRLPGCAGSHVSGGGARAGCGCGRWCDGRVDHKVGITAWPGQQAEGCRREHAAACTVPFPPLHVKPAHLPPCSRYTPVPQPGEAAARSHAHWHAPQCAHQGPCD